MRIDSAAVRLAGWAMWAAAFVLAALVTASALGASFSPTMKVALAAVLLAAATAPLVGLAALLALTPLGSIWGAQAGVPAFTEALVAAAASGWLLRVPRGGGGGVLPRVCVPAALMGFVAFLSGLVQLAAIRLTFEPGTFAPALWRALTRDYFLDRATFSPLFASAAMIEAMGVTVAAAALTRDRRDGFALAVRMLIAGGTAAAALTLLRVFAGALRTGTPWTALGDLMTGIRLNVTHADLNAAGSYYVLTILATAGLAAAKIAERRFRAVTVLVACAGVQGCGLWLTGSRTAQAVLVFAGLAWGAMVSWRARSRKAALITAGAVVLLSLAATLIVLRLSQNQISASGTLHVRTEMARAGLRMLGTDPWFGIGIGRFHEMSAQFIESPLVLQYYPKGENAHNYFVQVLAELGVAGAALFSWLVGAVLVGARPLLHERLGQGVFAGVGAFLLTCLTGHPLLVREVALPFWMTAGMLAASATAPASPASRQWGVRLALVCVVVMTAVLPIRMRHAEQGAYLEHVSFGTTGWQTDEDGTKYREFSSSATFYAPTSASVITSRMRTVGPVPVTIEARWTGRLGATLTLPDREWHDVLLRVPPTRGAGGFIRLDLNARSAGDGPATVRVGKLTIMRPRIDQ